MNNKESKKLKKTLVAMKVARELILVHGLDQLGNGKESTGYKLLTSAIESWGVK